VILSCVQPSYLAWIPLFKRICSGDVFVYLDDVEYSKNSFHNRNFVKGSHGKILLTVPVKYKGFGHKYICEIQINNESNWGQKHWRTIEMNYSKAPFFSDFGNIIYEKIYDRSWKLLGDLNVTFIEIIKDYLGINRKTYRSSELKVKGQGNQKLVSICKELGADRFLVKPNTESYHPEAFFKEHGIGLVSFEPEPKPYPQYYGDFIPNLSAVDYAMTCGPGNLDW